MAKKILENLRALVVLIIFLPVSSQGAMAQDQTLGDGAMAQDQTLRDVVFSDYGDSSSNPELVRRLQSPLTADRIRQELKRSGKTLAAQPLNLSEERFIVHLPPHQPDGGFALLVFVPPWQGAQLPREWVPVLDRYGVIFVSAARSGNDESVSGRREPLALLAALNIMKLHPVHPEHIYIAGFSGGSRIALRLALGYPDVFHGAILNAGSDSIGDGGIPLPPKDLFLRFQDSTHLIYVTGDRDSEHLVDDMVSIRSMHKWCVFNVEDYIQPRVGHEPAGVPALSRALEGLLNGSSRPDSGKLAACRSAIDSDLEKKFQKVQSLGAAGRRADVDKLLMEIDERYGGLAAPRSVELASK
jgi:pimeloyl-ACP methyl ester carboxylesterase